MNNNFIPPIQKHHSHSNTASTANKVINFAPAENLQHKRVNALFTTKSNSTKNKLLTPNDMNVISFIERRDIRQTVLQKSKRHAYGDSDNDSNPLFKTIDAKSLSMNILKLHNNNDSRSLSKNSQSKSMVELPYSSMCSSKKELKKIYLKYMPKKERYNLEMTHIKPENAFKSYLFGYNKSRSGAKFKSFSSSSIVIKKQPQKEIVIRRLLKEKKTLFTFNSSIRLRMLKWLWLNKRNLIEQFLILYTNYKFFFENHLTNTTRKLLEEFLEFTNMPIDHLFLEVIYSLFENKKTKTINILESIFWFTITSLDTFDNKLRTVISYITNANGIKEEQLVQLMQFFLSSKDVKNVIALLKGYVTNDKEDLLLTTSELIEFINEYDEVRMLFEKGFIRYCDVDEDDSKDVGNAYNILRNSQLNGNATKVFMRKTVADIEGVLKKMKRKDEAMKKMQNVVDDSDDNI